MPTSTQVQYQIAEWMQRLCRLLSTLRHCYQLDVSVWSNIHPIWKKNYTIKTERKTFRSNDFRNENPWINQKSENQKIKKPLVLKSNPPGNICRCNWRDCGCNHWLWHRFDSDGNSLVEWNALLWNRPNRLAQWHHSTWASFVHYPRQPNHPDLSVRWCCVAIFAVNRRDQLWTGKQLYQRPIQRWKRFPRGLQTMIDKNGNLILLL